MEVKLENGERSPVLEVLLPKWEKEIADLLSEFNNSFDYVFLEGNTYFLYQFWT